mmetsp:Transcript_18613/g.45801  ORF Transcript_18613/g.45801 Transcript_18613/m.45801 type:complete len:221 (-) Transcript_18613:467-1129(-)
MVPTLRQNIGIVCRTLDWQVSRRRIPGTVKHPPWDGFLLGQPQALPTTPSLPRRRGSHSHMHRSLTLALGTSRCNVQLLEFGTVRSVEKPSCSSQTSNDPTLGRGRNETYSSFGISRRLLTVSQTALSPVVRTPERPRSVIFFWRNETHGLIRSTTGPTSIIRPTMCQGLGPCYCNYSLNWSTFTQRPTSERTPCLRLAPDCLTARASIRATCGKSDLHR